MEHEILIDKLTHMTSDSEIEKYKKKTLTILKIKSVIIALVGMAILSWLWPYTQLEVSTNYTLKEITIGILIPVLAGMIAVAFGHIWYEYTAIKKEIITLNKSQQCSKLLALVETDIESKKEVERINTYGRQLYNFDLDYICQKRLKNTYREIKEAIHNNNVQQNKAEELACKKLHGLI